MKEVHEYNALAGALKSLACDAVLNRQGGRRKLSV